MDEIDVQLPDGRTLHAYDRGGATDALPVFWLHGTPNIGPPPEPLFADADRLGLRWVGYDRPAYGGSTARPGRDVASAAGDVAAVADTLGLERFAVIGHSGGASHALACGALLPDRVVAVVGGSGLAPFDAPGLDWFAGMAELGVASLGAAAKGRAAKEAHEAVEHEGDFGFVPADFEALQGEWAWFMKVVGPAMAAGPGGAIDDDLASVGPWGFAPEDVSVPTLLLHGGADRVVPPTHSEWLSKHVPEAELRLVPDEGHVSVLRHATSALEWIRDRA